LTAGVEQVRLVEPRNRAVLVYHSATQVEKFEEQDTLTGAGTLAGFTLSVADLFRG
jgi:Uma2 family endonuclease